MTYDFSTQLHLCMNFMKKKRKKYSRAFNQHSSIKAFNLMDHDPGLKRKFELLGN